MASERTGNTGVLQRIAAGEADAVNECLDRFGGLVWSLARRFCANPTDAEDAVQEVFTEIWTKADRYKPEVASEKTFVTMLARRRLIDMLRKRGRAPRETAIEDVQLASQPQPSTMERSEEVERVERAIDELKPIQREALRMAIYDNCTHARIAEVMDIPLGTVKTSIRRGLQRVRDALKVDETGDGSGA